MSVTIRRGIHKARKHYRCDGCKRTIRPGDTYARLFGMADRTDPPTELTLCEECGYIKEPLRPRQVSA